MGATLLIVIVVWLGVIGFVTLLLGVMLLADWLAGRPIVADDPQPLSKRELDELEAYRAHMTLFLANDRDVRERAEQAYRKVGGRMRAKFTVIDGDG